MRHISILVVWLFAVLVVFYSNVSNAASIQQEQLDQSRIQEEERFERMKQERTEVDIPSAPSKAISSDETDVHVFIDKITLENETNQFHFLRTIARGYEGRELSLKDINEAVNKMNRELLKRGFSTSRVVIPEQNLSKGMLRLVLQIGRIHEIRFSEGSDTLYTGNLFPFREGDILNVRDIEQGMEQAKRLPSQDITVKLLPAQEPQMTDIVLMVTRGRNVYGTISMDDSGLEDTGKLQFYGSIGVDQIFQRNDILRIGMNLDGAQDGYVKGTRGHHVSYTIPYGNHTFTLSYQRSKYHQTVKSNPYDFISAGDTNISTFSWDYVLHRTANRKTSMDLRLRKRNSHSFINDVELPIQAMHQTSLELGYAERLYMGRDTLYFRLAHCFGLGWLGAQEEKTYPLAPKTRYRLWVFDADYVHPIRLGSRPATFTSSFHGQYAMNGVRLYGVDMISMGNRYTVRGFDGELILMGTNGWYLRNELAMKFPTQRMELYLGLDFGAVYGYGTELFNGRMLAGAVLGLRGLVGNVFYDVFVSAPVEKTEGFHTPDITGGFSLGAKF